MKIIILLTLCLCAVPGAWAETKPKFQVGSISKGRTAAGTTRINGVYPPAKPTIEFSVTLAEDMPMTELVNIIYYFDANNKLVYQMSASLDLDRTHYDQDLLVSKMERMQREKKGSQGISIQRDIIKTAKAGRKYYFRHVVQERDPKWTHIVVMAGSKTGDRTGRVYPKADPKIFDFSDKALITFWFES